MLRNKNCVVRIFNKFEPSMERKVQFFSKTAGENDVYLAGSSSEKVAESFKEHIHWGMEVYFKNRLVFVHYVMFIQSHTLLASIF